MDTTKPRTPSMPQTANLTADVARARATREAATAQVLAMRTQLTQQALNDALERIDVAYAATVRDNASLSAGAAHNRHAQALEAMGDARTKSDAERNWTKIQALTAEVKAQMEQAPQHGMGSAGRTPADVVARLADRYRSSGDFDALRALRVAGADAAAKVPELRAAFERDEFDEMGEAGRLAAQAQADARSDMMGLEGVVIRAIGDVAGLGAAFSVANSVFHTYRDMTTPYLPEEAQA
ncbi:MAG: hypothetical protein NT029_01235 [Armatimonadetes bacterium]|nr:hypothetical protein [Armatimonadota bacterium]